MRFFEEETKILEWLFAKLSKSYEVSRSLTRGRLSSRNDSVSKRKVRKNRERGEPRPPEPGAEKKADGRRGGENHEEERIESTKESGSVIHRRRLPSDKAGAFFVDHLKVSADSLDPCVHEVVDFERRREQNERQKR